MPNDAEIKAIVERSVGKDIKDRIFQSRSAAERYLASPEPNVRCAALVAIKCYWGPDDAFKESCERLVLADRSPAVRKCALASIFSCYRESDPGHAGRIAALLVYDNTQPSELRNDAYRLLFRLYLPHRITVSHPLSPDAAGFRFPNDVDWKLVDTFLYPAQGRGNGTGPIIE